MSKLQKIIKVTKEQHQILSDGGTVGDYTGLNPDYIYLIEEDGTEEFSEINVTDIANLNSVNIATEAVVTTTLTVYGDDLESGTYPSFNGDSSNDSADIDATFYGTGIRTVNCDTDQTFDYSFPDKSGVLLVDTVADEKYATVEQMSEEILEVISDNSEEVDEFQLRELEIQEMPIYEAAGLDIGTSSSYDATSDSEIPTTKAVDTLVSEKIATNSTKVEASSTNGNIKVDGTEVTVYTHPTGTNPHGTTKEDIGLGNVENIVAAPKEHTHGNIDKDGKLGTASKIVVTDANGAIALGDINPTDLFTKSTGGKITNNVTIEGITTLGQSLPSKGDGNTVYKGVDLSMLTTVSGVSGLYVNSSKNNLLYCLHYNNDLECTCTYKGDGTNVAPTTADVWYATRYSDTKKDSGYLGSLFEGGLANGATFPIAELSTKPVVLTIKTTSNTRLDVTDTIAFGITGWRYEGNPDTSYHYGYLTDYKLEVCTDWENDTWVETFNRTNVKDWVTNLIIPCWSTLGGTENYTSIFGIRLTISGAGAQGLKNPDCFGITELRCYERRPSGKPADGVGAPTKLHPTVYGNLTMASKYSDDAIRPAVADSIFLGTSDKPFRRAYINEIWEKGKKLPEKYVKYDEAYSLTDAQKTQARANIGAADAGHSHENVSNISNVDNTTTITGGLNVSDQIYGTGGMQIEGTTSVYDLNVDGSTTFMNDITLNANIDVYCGNINISDGSISINEKSVATEADVSDVQTKLNNLVTDIAGAGYSYTKVTSKAQLTNLLDLSTVSNGNRLNSSGGLTADVNYSVTGYIPFTAADTLYLSNHKNIDNGNFEYIAFYDKDYIALPNSSNNYALRYTNNFDTEPMPCRASHGVVFRYDYDKHAFDEITLAATFPNPDKVAYIRLSMSTKNLTEDTVISTEGRVGGYMKVANRHLAISPDVNFGSKTLMEIDAVVDGIAEELDQIVERGVEYKKATAENLPNSLDLAASHLNRRLSGDGTLKAGEFAGYAVSNFIPYNTGQTIYFANHNKQINSDQYNYIAFYPTAEDTGTSYFFRGAILSNATVDGDYYHASNGISFKYDSDTHTFNEISTNVSGLNYFRISTRIENLTEDTVISTEGKPGDFIKVVLPEDQADVLSCGNLGLNAARLTEVESKVNELSTVSDLLSEVTVDDLKTSSKFATDFVTKNVKYLEITDPTELNNLLVPAEFETDKRLNSSGTTTSLADYVVSNKIYCTPGETLYISNNRKVVDNRSYNYIAVYDENDTLLDLTRGVIVESYEKPNIGKGNLLWEYDYDFNVFTKLYINPKASWTSEPAYIKISANKKNLNADTVVSKIGSLGGFKACPVSGLYESDSYLDVENLGLTKARLDKVDKEILNLKSGVVDNSDVLSKYKDQLENAEIFGYGSSGEFAPLNFLHISDTHGSPNTLNAVKILNYLHTQNQGVSGLENCYCSFLLMTGDFHSSTFKDDFATTKSYIDQAVAPVFLVAGNHDVGNNSTSASDGTTATDYQYYERCVAPFLDKWQVTSNPDGKNYWYKDYPNSGVRVIGLYEFESDYETVDGDPTTLKDMRGHSAFRQEQIDWLIEALMTCPAGWGVIIAKHNPVNLRGATENNFNSRHLIGKNTAQVSDAANKNLIADIVQAFIKGEQLNKTYTQSKNIRETLILQADFSNKNAGADFICYCNGHTHADGVNFLQDYPDQLELNINCDNYHYQHYSDMHNEFGTNHQDVLNYVSVDVNNKYVYILRIGNDFSAYAGERDSLSIKYRPEPKQDTVEVLTAADLIPENIEINNTSLAYLPGVDVNLDELLVQIDLGLRDHSNQISDLQTNQANGVTSADLLAAEQRIGAEITSLQSTITDYDQWRYETVPNTFLGLNEYGDVARDTLIIPSSLKFGTTYMAANRDAISYTKAGSGQPERLTFGSPMCETVIMGGNKIKVGKLGNSGTDYSEMVTSISTTDESFINLSSTSNTDLGSIGVCSEFAHGFTYLGLGATDPTEHLRLAYRTPSGNYKQILVNDDLETAKTEIWTDIMSNTEVFNPDSAGANTAGSSNYTSKIFLVGAPTQSADGVVTYSDSRVYTSGGEVTASSFYATSDIRLKQNIEDYTCKKSILDLPVKKYELISDPEKIHIGCIAQDLQEICPEIVNTDENGYLSVNESKIVYLLLDEVKKLRKEMNELRSK